MMPERVREERRIDTFFIVPISDLVASRIRAQIIVDLVASRIRAQIIVDVTATLTR